LNDDRYAGGAVRSAKRSTQKGGNAKRLLLVVPIVLICLAIIIIPHIDLNGAKAKIVAVVSPQLNGKVVIAHAAVSLLPLPHLSLKGVKIESPEWGVFASPEVRIYPRLLPLFQNKISVKRLVIRGPILDLVLRRETIERGKDIFSYVDQTVMRMIPALEVEGGIVNLLRLGEREPFFTAHALTGAIASSKKGRMRLDLRFSSPWTEGIVLRVSTRAQGRKGTSCSFFATGTGVQVAKIRGIILEFFGKEEAVQEVFHIVRGGELSRITFRGEGSTLAEALDFERNMKIRGTLAAGQILTPPGPLPLEGVSGEFEIKEAVLRCWDTDGRLGKSIARGFKLVVGLISEREDFHLESFIDADAKDLVRYLPLVLKDKALRSEIESFREAKGRGRGRVVLGENINHIRPQVEVESFQCSFRHASSAGRISLDGGQLSFHNGNAVWKVDAVTWRGCRWSNIVGNITFGNRGIELTVAKADFCGLQCKGSIYSHAGVITHSFRFWADEADLSSAIRCLWGKDARIEGAFLFEGDMWAEGMEDPLSESSEGSLLFISKKGRIYRWTLLSQLFSMLNVMGFFEGKFPDFTQQGFPYDQFIITGELRDGSVYLKEAVIDGPAMKIVGEGKIDLVKGEADIVVLLAPLKTIDTVMHHIPIVGRIIAGKNGTFISVPFRVKGPFDTPKVTLLPPEAVGSGLWGVLKRTLQAPVEMFKAVISQQEPSFFLPQKKAN
jgi:hypothetical protein